MNLATNKMKLSRAFNAHREQIFKLWVTPEHFEKWFCPPGATTTMMHADIRPGGYCQQAIHSPGWEEFYTKVAFQEISTPERIVFVTSFIDRDGQLTKHPFIDQWPDFLLATITFDDQGESTLITVEWEPIEATLAEATCFGDHLSDCHAGWNGTFDHLDDLIASQA